MNATVRCMYVLAEANAQPHSPHLQRNGQCGMLPAAIMLATVKATMRDSFDDSAICEGHCPTIRTSVCSARCFAEISVRDVAAKRRLDQTSGDARLLPAYCSN